MRSIWRIISSHGGRFCPPARAATMPCVASPLSRGPLRRFVAISSVLLASCSSAGPGVDCFKDDSVPRSEWTTPSAEAIAAAEPKPAIRQRNWPQAEAVPERDGVPHFPLWWEDPFEDKGSQDGKFAWTWEDYVALPYSNARWLLNTMLWPASAVVTPPGTSMISDGRLSRQLLGYDHDAIPGKSWVVGTQEQEAAEPPTTQPAK